MFGSAGIRESKGQKNTQPLKHNAVPPSRLYPMPLNSLLPNSDKRALEQIQCVKWKGNNENSLLSKRAEEDVGRRCKLVAAVSQLCIKFSNLRILSSEFPAQNNLRWERVEQWQNVTSWPSSMLKPSLLQKSLRPFSRATVMKLRDMILVVLPTGTPHLSRDNGISILDSKTLFLLHCGSTEHFSQKHTIPQRPAAAA